MGFEKDKQLERQENWHEFALQSGKKCSYCSQILTYEEYQAFGLKLHAQRAPQSLGRGRIFRA